MTNSDCFKINNKSPIKVENKIRIEKRVYNDPPSLSLLVDELSYLPFDRIGLDKQRIRDWLTFHLSIGATSVLVPLQPSFRIFKEFAKSLVVVNDPAQKSSRNDATV